MTKAVFFDWYNTLVRYEPPPEKLQVAACRAFDIVVAPETMWRALPMADQYFYGENSRFPVEKRSAAEQAEVYYRYEEIILKEAGVEASRDLILNILRKVRELAQKSTFVLFDDTLPTLKLLKFKKLILGMISNLPQDKLPVCHELGLTSYLDFIITPQEAGVDKPNPGIFEAALQKAGVEAAEAIHVGDQYHIDVVGAQSVGIKALLIDRYKLFSEVEDCPRITSLSEVVDYL